MAKKYVKRICYHEGCERIAVQSFESKWYCNKHISRCRKYGDSSINRNPKFMGTIKERLLHNAVVNPKTNCWEWQLSLDKGGYGNISIGNIPYQVHRVSYETFVHKLVPKTLHVLHDCDNRRCINPEHLFTGTNYDNMQDRNIKGRQAKGTMFSTSKLTEDKVKDIKNQFKEFVPFDEIGFSNQCGLIADKYNVSGKLIRNIYHGTAWKHVD